jgi:pantoate--beta-alanine ligase
MGYLHEGHVRLIRRSVAENDITVVSLFVNPLQFDEQSDLDRYPRDFDRDRSIVEQAGADVLFAPAAEEMFPHPPATTVRVDQLADHMEGVHRRGHFDGVATVVTKLFAGVQPNAAYFGRKDAQQLAVVSTLTVDLSLPVRVVAVSTVRESDGLALSSRNVFLSDTDRSLASGISQGLFAAADLVDAGETAGASLIAACRDHLTGLEIEYVELADQRSAQPVQRLEEPSFLAVSAQVGATRLIDNVAFDLVNGEWFPDRGQPLDGRSMLYEGRDAAGR